MYIMLNKECSSFQVARFFQSLLVIEVKVKIEVKKIMKLLSLHHKM